MPDIETDALLVQKDGERSWIRLQPSAHKRREADYDFHLEHPSARHGEKPLETISYLLVPKTGDKTKIHDDDDPAADPDDDEEAEEDADQKTDFLIDFARDLLAQAVIMRRDPSGSSAFLTRSGPKTRRSRRRSRSSASTGAPGRRPAPTRSCS